MYIKETGMAQRHSIAEARNNLPSLVRGAEYGKAVLEDLSKRLTYDFGKGYSVQNLRYMRQFLIRLLSDIPGLKRGISGKH